MNNAVIGIGTNMGDKMFNINKAVEALNSLPQTKVVKTSYVYQTEPVGCTNQADFLNSAVQLETNLTPSALLGACLGIEAVLGRVRTIKNGPRTIDLDLLLYGSVKMETFELTLPHPRILERAFVMVPLLDLFPTGRAVGLFFGPKLKELTATGVKKIEDAIELKSN